MKVQQIMSRPLHTTTANTPLSESCRLMWEHDCGVLPVLDPRTRRLTGILTDRDACMAAFTNGQSLTRIPTSVAMAKKPVTCREDDELATVHATMRTHQVRRLPVTNDGGECVGLVSLNDLAVAAAEQRGQGDKLAVAETLAAICKHRVELPVPREPVLARF